MKYSVVANCDTNSLYILLQNVRIMDILTVRKMTWIYRRST